MDSAIDPVLAARGGFASVHELGSLGVSRHVVDAAVRAGRLHRLRRDVVVDAQVWRTAAPWDRHAIRARAVMRSIDPEGVRPVALSHHSALALNGLPVWGVDERVHLVRTDGRRGHTTGLVQVHQPLDAAVVHAANGVAAVHPALACLQVAATFGVESGLVSADLGLHDQRITAAELTRWVEHGRFGNQASSVTVVGELADGRIESAAESRARWRCVLAGLPTPEPQVVITDADGRFVARTDFLFREHRTVVEVDGMGKYTDPASLRAEKRREDRLRELGYQVVRLTWADLADVAALAAKIRAAFARNAAAAA